MIFSTQARYWFATIACKHNNEQWTPTSGLLDDQITYIKGQREIGAEGYEHWQMVIYCSKKIRLNSLKEKIPKWSHLEQCKSQAAEDYVWKDDTAVLGTRFEHGIKSSKKPKHNMDEILHNAKIGNMNDIPSEIIIRHYSTIKKISTDFGQCIERPGIQVIIHWGITGSGKTHDAYYASKSMAGGFFRKSSTTKWWDGYQSEENILIDEFDGQSIGITHFLQWCDWYPMQVEIKGGSANLFAKSFYITSNIDPKEWWPEANQMHKDAFRRRITNVIHYNNVYKKDDIDELYFKLIN